jgi:hypothetical protein
MLHPSLGSVESLDISASTLNVFKLVSLGAVRILWTNNLSRHLLLSNNAKTTYLQLFALPSALHDGPSSILQHTGIDPDLMEEVSLSYTNLFNPQKPTSWHHSGGRLLGIRLWCWCLSCSSRRLVYQELKALKSSTRVSGKINSKDPTVPLFDPVLVGLMTARAKGWDQTEFEHL